MFVVSEVIFIVVTIVRIDVLMVCIVGNTGDVLIVFISTVDSIKISEECKLTGVVPTSIVSFLLSEFTSVVLTRDDSVLAVVANL